jgi:hypothetical protein
MNNSKKNGQKGWQIYEDSQQNLYRIKNTIKSGESKLELCNLRIPERTRVVFGIRVF